MYLLSIWTSEVLSWWQHPGYSLWSFWPYMNNLHWYILMKIAKGIQSHPYCCHFFLIKPLNAFQYSKCWFVWWERIFASLGWYWVGCHHMPQLVVFSIQHIPTCANIHKKWLRKRKNPKTASWSSLALKMCTWGSGPSTSPLGVTFDPEIENLCGNHMLWTFSIFCWKKFCYSFFRLYIVKLVHFSGFCPF